MQKGVSLCIMDLSGQSTGTDHIRTRSAEVCQLLPTSISRPIKLCLLNTGAFVHCAPKTQKRKFTWSFVLKFEDQTVLHDYVRYIYLYLNIYMHKLWLFCNAAGVLCDK